MQMRKGRCIEGVRGFVCSWSPQSLGFSTGPQCVYLLAAVFSVLLIVSAKSQQIELDIAAAEVARSVDGRPAVAVTFDAESSRAFSDFSRASVGRKLEFRFNGKVLDTAVPRSPVFGGRIQLVGTMTDDGAAEIQRKLSVSGAKLEVRVIDETK